jgi:FkbM family methyltransferase
MKKLLTTLSKNIGVLPYLHVLREIYFPTKYYKSAQAGYKRYVEFYSQFINPGDLCFDIGAHKGHRTEIFLKIGARVVSVEPQIDCYKYLHFKYGKRIKLERCGLGAEMGVEEMYINNSSSLSTFSKEWTNEALLGRFSDTKWVDKKQIEIKTLDSMIEKYGVPKFCKIDVETYEYQVLLGLSESIEFISFEFMLPENFDILKKCINQVFKINPKAVFNYSIGDSLHIELSCWVGVNGINDFFKERIFSSPSWGDIYVRMS